MKKAFTLIELLVVVLVIASLVGIVFRLGNITGAQTAEATTVVKLQKLENCLSGYYAAFGNYPPVKLHGRRSIFYRVNEYGIQQVEENEQPGVLNWKQVDAACKSQPVTMNFPFSNEDLSFIDKVSKALKKKHDDGVKPYCNIPEFGYLFDGIRNPEMLSNKKDLSDWCYVQIYRFGLLSFLVPRYQVIMGSRGTRDMFDYAQWDDNNGEKGPCRFDDGLPYSWSGLLSDCSSKENRWKVKLIPSQAITERWKPNLKGIVPFDEKTGEIKITAESFISETMKEPPTLYSAGNSQNGDAAFGTQQYILNEVTVKDGWDNELYYYSPRPYQTYRLWSAGPNGKTFPPWIPDETIKKFGAADQKAIADWLSDDIVKMKE